MARNVDLAEELAQDALVVALSEWPKTGVPANPGAWLTFSAPARTLATGSDDPNVRAGGDGCSGQIGARARREQQRDPRHIVR